MKVRVQGIDEPVYLRESGLGMSIDASAGLDRAVVREIRFTVEVKTTGANAREHFHAASSRIAKERNAVAAVWQRLVRPIPGMLEAATVERILRGTPMKIRKLAKTIGKSLRVRENVLLPLVPLRVELTRVSWGTLDPFENLPHSLKGVVDELAWQMGITDRDPLVLWAPPKQERGPKKYYAVKVRIVVRGDA